MGLMERFHVRERMDVIAKWFQMGSCLSGGTMMGGYYPPELMQSFLASVDEYENSIEKLREKTKKNSKIG